MHLQSIRIRNLRVFRDVEVRVQELNPKVALSNVHVFLGTNGSGKTSLLRAIALTAVSEVLPSSGLRLYSLARRVGPAPKACRLDAVFSLGDQDGVHTAQRRSVSSRLTIEPRSGFNDSFGSKAYPSELKQIVWDDRSPAALVLGYGATRRVETHAGAALQVQTARDRGLRYGRVAGLFEEHVPMLPLNAWLPRYAGRNPGRHTQVVTLVNELLADVDITLHPKAIDGEYLFQVGTARLPLAALSDGYRAYIGWISDMLYHVCMGCPTGKKLTDNEGIVLIDEIDLHLHPQWQRLVIPRLSRALPRLQFFLTSHSPLVAGSVPAANISVVEKPGAAEGASVTAGAYDVYGWSSDQILASPLFNETASRNEEAVQAIKTASVRARRGDRQAAFDLMHVLAEGVPQPASSPVSPPRKPARAARARPAANAKPARRSAG